MSIRNSVLAVTPTTIYTSVGQTAATLIYFCNRSLSAITFTVHVLPAGSLVSPVNMIYYDVQLAPTDTYILDTERLILDHDDSIVAFASQPDAVSTTVSYVEV